MDNYFYPGGHMMGPGYMNWMMIFFWIILLFVLILIVQWILRLGKEKTKAMAALDILKMRLAKGEIDIEEFKEKKGLILPL